MRKEFDPAENFETIAEEVDLLIGDLTAKLERLRWLRGKMADQMARNKKAHDLFETYTEAEAGQMFKLADDPEQAARAMRDARRIHEFPFMKIGREVRYTREHLREIAAMLEMNAKPRKAIQAAPLRKAA